MKTVHIAIGAGVAVVVYFAFKAISKAKADARTASYGTGAPEASIPQSFWNGTSWQSGPAAPGNTPPNGAPPAPPSPLDYLGQLSAQAWALAENQTAKFQTPLGATQLPRERVTAQTLPLPTLYGG